MEFIDKTGHIFSLDNYRDSIGYELKDNKYIFWVNNPIGIPDLSVNLYYLEQITPYISKNNLLDIFQTPNSAIDINSVNYIKVSVDSERFSLIKYNEIKTDDNLTIDLNKIPDLKSISYSKDQFIIDEESSDLIAPFFVLAKSSDEGTFTTNALIEVNFGSNQSIYNVITFGGTFVGEDEKYTINVNNFGCEIPKGIINAVYQGELNLNNYQNNINNFDFTLYNTKLREYLLYNKSLKNNKGNYNSIKSHLDWFGWGTDLTLTKLLKTDNQFMNQYLVRDYSSNGDSNALIKRFIHSALVNIRLESHEILYDYIEKTKIVKREKQIWNKYNNWVGEGVVLTDNLFDKYVGVDLEQNSKLQYVEPFFKYSLNTILIKLAFLKYYYKKYFLPVHVDALSCDVDRRCFIPDIKFYTETKSSFTTPMLLNAENNFVKIGNEISEKNVETIYLTRSTRYIESNFVQFEHPTDNSSKTLYEVKEMHAQIPLRFFKNVDEYFADEMKEDLNYIYNATIFVSKYNKVTKNYSNVSSTNFVFTKNESGNTDSIIIIPKTNGENHDTIWYDDEENVYRIDVNSNGTWFSKEFKIEFPPVIFELGYLEYTYQAPGEPKSPFSSKIGQSFMREPDLVTVDNINFSHDAGDLCLFYEDHDDSKNISSNYINLYRDQYNIPSRNTNPELYNVVLYFDLKDDYSDCFDDATNYKNTIIKLNDFLDSIIENYKFSDFFDSYLMYQPIQFEYKTETIKENIKQTYLVLISKQTSSDEHYEEIEKTIKYIKENIKKFNLIKSAIITYRFLINRFKVITYEDNVVDPSKLMTCAVSSVYEINVPFNLRNGLKWNFSPYSILNNQTFNITSKANIGLVSIPRFQGKHPSGYYNIVINYSMTGKAINTIKAPFKILFKE
jgi:hypothetical protein